VSTVTEARRRETAEDVYFGQVVILWARWFFIAAAAVLALATTDDSTRLAVAVVPVVALMAMNFALHGRTFVGRPANRRLIAAASLVDLVAITAIVAFWHDGGIGTGIASPFFVFYYPLLLAFAFVQPRRLSAAYTALAVVAYTAACAPGVDTALELKAMVLRVVTLAAMGALGTFYWRIQRDRRRASWAGGA
jgi:hypothetical protein